MAKIPRVPVENEVTTLSVVKIAIKFSPCTLPYCSSEATSVCPSFTQQMDSPPVEILDF